MNGFIGEPADEITGIREIKRERVSDTVYHMLRTLIINKTFSPGEKLNVDELAQRMGVSRTPVHEGLSRLAEDGLVEIVPRKGTFVTELTTADLSETLDLRRALELLAAETAVDHVTAEDIAQMRAIVGELAESMKSEDDVPEHFQKNLTLHERLVELSMNRKLIDWYRNLDAHIRMARAHCAASSGWKERIPQEYEEHMAIIDALERKDVAALKEALNTHLQRAKRSLLADLEQEAARRGVGSA